jgi:hypothetical protein
LRFGLSPVQSDKSFEAMLRQLKLAEALGYDVLWAHEHHSGAAMYRSLLTTLAVLAARTERIGLGTNMLLLPLHHPSEGSRRRRDHRCPVRRSPEARCQRRIRPRGFARVAVLGVTEIACLMNFGAPEEHAVENSIRLFAERVMPNLSVL